MQLPVPFTSQGWSDRILWLVLGLFGGGGLATIVATLLNQLLNRKQQHSQVAKNHADAQHITLDGLVKSSNQIMVLMDRLNRLEGDMDAERRRHEESVTFYRKQIEFFEGRIKGFDEQIKRYKELDLAYRNRSHDLNGEMNRLVASIRKLELKYTQDTEKTITPIPGPAIEEINKKWPLPAEPPSNGQDDEAEC